jgi:hypothetical protein
MVKSILKDYPEVAAPVKVRVVDDEQTPTRCGARTRRTSCSWATKAASPPRSIPWRDVERIEITFSDE